MEHQAGKAEAVEGFVLSFRSKNKENIGTQTSHCVWGRWEQGASLADLVHSGFVNGIRYDHLTFPLCSGLRTTGA